MGLKDIEVRIPIAGGYKNAFFKQAFLVTALSAPTALHIQLIPHSTLKQLRFLRMHRTVSGGVPSAFTIMPALPVGLNFNASTEKSQVRLTGFTSAYAVTATNSAGLAQTTLNLSVKDETILGFSYATPIATYTVGGEIVPNLPLSSGELRHRILQLVCLQD